MSLIAFLVTGGTYLCFLQTKKCISYHTIRLVLSWCDTHCICIAGARFCKMYPLWTVLLSCRTVSLQFHLLKLAVFCHYEGQQPYFGRKNKHFYLFVINCGIIWQLSLKFTLDTVTLECTVCPTRYRTRHFFNNSNTNEDIATKFEQEYVPWFDLQLDALNSCLFTYNTFIKLLYMFRALTLLIIRRSTS